MSNTPTRPATFQFRPSIISVNNANASAQQQQQQSTVAQRSASPSAAGAADNRSSASPSPAPVTGTHVPLASSGADSPHSTATSRGATPLLLPSPVQRALQRPVDSPPLQPLTATAAATANAPALNLRTTAADASKTAASSSSPILSTSVSSDKLSFARSSSGSPSPSLPQQQSQPAPATNPITSSPLFQARPSSAGSSGSAVKRPPLQTLTPTFARMPTATRILQFNDAKDASGGSESLNQPLLTDKERDSGSGDFADDLRKPPMAALSTDTSAQVTAAASAYDLSSPTDAVPSHYEMYEATVRKIRDRRERETAKKNAEATHTPEQTKREYRLIASVLILVVIVISMVIYLLYPRIPIWSINRTGIAEMKLLSDGTAILAFDTDVVINNPNFMSTGVNSIAMAVSHKGTLLGQTARTEAMRWAGRTRTDMTFSHDFGQLDNDKFASLWQEMRATNGHLTLDYGIAVVTSETFRLRNLIINCTVVLQLDAHYVPPSSTMRDAVCSHTEQTG